MIGKEEILEETAFNDKAVLRFIGYHGGTDIYRLEHHFGVERHKLQKMLDELYGRGHLVAFFNATCPETGESLPTQRLEDIPLEEYVYECEDMDGECVFCGWSHKLTVEDVTLNFSLHEKLKEQYPRRKYVNKKDEKIKGLIAQIDEMHRFIIQLKEGALANRYTARIFLEVDDPEGNYYVGPDGQYWRQPRLSEPYPGPWKPDVPAEEVK